MLGPRLAVLVGGLVIAAGHFTMLIGDERFLYVGLGVIVVGTGLLKPNMSTMVGGLYADDDPRRDSGFSIFYMGINVGALLAPLLVGYLGQDVDWNLGFAAAGIGMILGLAQYVYGWRYLGEVGHHASHPVTRAERNPLVLRIGLGSGAVAALIVVLLVLWGFNTAEYAIDALIVAVPVVYFARTLAARESRPSSAAGCERSSCSSRLRPPSGSPPTREARSSRCSPRTTRTTRYWASALGFLFGVRGPDLHPRARPRVRLALAEARRPAAVDAGEVLDRPGARRRELGRDGARRGRGRGGKVSPIWLVGSIFIGTVAELRPVAGGAVRGDKAAPRAAVGTTMGIWFLSISVGRVRRSVRAALQRRQSPGVLRVARSRLRRRRSGALARGSADAAPDERGPLGRTVPHR